MIYSFTTHIILASPVRRKEGAGPPFQPDGLGGDFGLPALTDLHLKPCFSAPHPTATAVESGLPMPGLFHGVLRLTGSLLTGLPL